jgi:hypothetical protein
MVSPNDTTGQELMNTETCGENLLGKIVIFQA